MRAGSPHSNFGKCEHSITEFRYLQWKKCKNYITNSSNGVQTSLFRWEKIKQKIIKRGKNINMKHLPGFLRKSVHIFGLGKYTVPHNFVWKNYSHDGSTKMWWRKVQTGKIGKSIYWIEGSTRYLAILCENLNIRTVSTILWCRDVHTSKMRRTNIYSWEVHTIPHNFAWKKMSRWEVQHCDGRKCKNEK
jgi:hypothetical protein